MSDRRAGRWLAACAVAGLVLAGCTGVPTTSAPRTVEPIAGGAHTSQAQGPPRGAGPGAIVDGFLDANVRDPAGASKWLTALARNQWSDATVTVIADRSTSIYDAQRKTVSFTARLLGAVNSSGVYVPKTTGDGGGVVTSFSFGMTTVDRQYRINLLQRGLLVGADDFSTKYVRHNLYFYDRANRYLVPDVRYSAFSDPGELANWLLQQLVTGPRQELQNSVNTDTLPGQSRRVRITFGNPAQVQIPGAGQLASSVRDRLAAQLTWTLDDVLHGAPLRIEDGTAAVAIPAAGGALVSTADFASATGPAPPPPAVYYLRDGRVRAADGNALPGPFGRGSYIFTSIAVARPRTIGQLTIAAVQRIAGTSRLVVGTQRGGPRPTTVRGQLSRPAWAPGLAEVWIGNGSRLVAVTTDGRTSRAVDVSVPSAVGGGQIVAVRFSPDGSRVALVVSGVVGGQHRAVLLVGPVVRGTGGPQIAVLTAISPDGVVPTDVAWFDPLHLIATGTLAGSKEPRIFDTFVDGSAWNARDIGNLPTAPDALTATAGALVWVSTPGGFVWEQSGGPSSWISPSEPGQTSGTQPTYLS